VSRKAPGVIITVRNGTADPVVLPFLPGTAEARHVKVTAFPDGDLIVALRFGRVLRRFGPGEWTGYSYDLMTRRAGDRPDAHGHSGTDTDRRKT
jgi:hypothetical protein